METPLNWPEEVRYINKCINDAVDLFLEFPNELEELNEDISSKVQIRPLDQKHPAYKGGRYVCAECVCTCACSDAVW